MKMFMVISLFAISASASAFFNKSSNDLIAFCTVDNEKGGELVYQKFAKEKSEQDVSIHRLVGHLRLNARFIINTKYLDKKLTFIDLDVADTTTKQKVRAQGLSIPGSSLSADIDQGETSAGASCELIDEKFLEENEFNNSAYLLLKDRIKNEK